MWLPVQRGAGFFFFWGVSACAKVGGCRRKRRKGWWLAGSCCGQGYQGTGPREGRAGRSLELPVGVWPVLCRLGGRLGNMSLRQPRPRNPHTQHQRCPRRAEITGVCRWRAWSRPSCPGVVVQDTRLRQPPHALCPPQPEPRGVPTAAGRRLGRRGWMCPHLGPGLLVGVPEKSAFPFRSGQFRLRALLSFPPRRTSRFSRALTASPTGNETYKSWGNTEQPPSKHR